MNPILTSMDPYREIAFFSSWRDYAESRKLVGEDFDRLGKDDKGSALTERCMFCVSFDKCMEQNTRKNWTERDCSGFTKSREYEGVGV